MTGVDPYDLPPSQALALEVLAARLRLGESYWTFSTRHRPALEGLRKRGLADWRPGVAQGTVTASLTDEGEAATLGGTCKAPAVLLLEEALFLRQNGAHAPGGRENWQDWDRKAETFLRGQLPPEREGDEP